MRAPVALFIASVTAPLSTAQAQSAAPTELGGIRVGAPKEEALRILRKHGQVQQRGDVYVGGSYAFVLCGGSVDNVSRRLERSFMAFARVTALRQAELGDPDNAGAATQEADRLIGRVEMVWASGNGLLYSVSYSEIDGAPYAGEMVRHERPCSQRLED